MTNLLQKTGLIFWNHLENRSIFSLSVGSAALTRFSKAFLIRDLWR